MANEKVKQLTAKAVSHANVKGRVLNYITITNGKETHFVNVGTKTYHAITALENEYTNPEGVDNLNS